MPSSKSFPALPRPLSMINRTSAAAATPMAIESSVLGMIEKEGRRRRKDARFHSIVPGQLIGREEKRATKGAKLGKLKVGLGNWDG